MPDSLLIRAFRGEPVSRPPVWFMRQAGRYLPEYRELRTGRTFLDLCRDPHLATEITLQPLRRFPLDAAIVFSDILLPLDCMGAGLSFDATHGPVFDHPVRDRAAIQHLSPFVPERDLPEPMETIRRCIQALDVPVLGFAGAPFTLACYLIEGRGSRDWAQVKSFMWRDPEAFALLLDRLAEVAAIHLQAQVDAGATAVQLFDTWAGTLSTADYRQFALPAARKALTAVRGAPTVYYTRDSAPFLPWLSQVGATAIGLDWRCDLTWARSILGDLPIQGNLDPSALAAPPEVLREQVHSVIRSAGRHGHIFNLGHGCQPHTPIDGVRVAIDTIRAWKWSAADSAASPGSDMPRASD